ncbi:MAG: hypothetical protein HY908_03075 [Myxococcales bacterium]|nr:hypothetical protein [Myxococcales bacterium]
MVLLGRHGLEPSLVLGLGAGLLDLGALHGLEASLFLARAPLVLFAATLLFADACFLGLARAALLLEALLLRASGGLLARFLFGLDAIFLDRHQLLEREENRAFLFLSHDPVELLSTYADRVRPF